MSVTGEVEGEPEEARFSRRAEGEEREQLLSSCSTGETGLNTNIRLSVTSGDDRSKQTLAYLHRDTGSET